LETTISFVQRAAEPRRTPAPADGAERRWRVPSAKFGKVAGVDHVNFTDQSELEVIRPMRESFPLSVAGDVGVGEYQPPSSNQPAPPRVADELLQSIRSLPGAASTASDVLDDLGVAMVTDGLRPRFVSGVTVGHVITVSYLPERRAISDPRLRETPSRLAHRTVFALALHGDVVVIDARGLESASVFGGMAGLAARAAGVSGCIVDGGVRDLDEIRALGLPLWSRAVTPRTGKWRLEATTINHPVMCGGVHVQPGDVAVADETGICFIPGESATDLLNRILAVAGQERRSRLAH
jgi:4-hydroxy-4-methyl-2-oxoglutarate aldolase